MKPIAQTFLVPEPANGVDAVFLTAVDLYFASADTSYGVELQIRTTLNGVPTFNRLPYASKILPASSVSTSSTASIATKFTFDTPVVLTTNQQYALVIIPVAGNPNYNVWTAAISGTDVTTTNQITNNNQLGSLFISSNDLNFTSVPLESMKYTLYTANFSSTSGTAVYKNSNTDYFSVKNIIGTFTSGEQIFMSNGFLNSAGINITGGYLNASTTPAVFSIGDVVFQTALNSGNTGTGKVVFANTSVVRLANITGSFVNTGNTIIKDSNILNQSYTTISSANQSIVTTLNTAVINVPDVTSTVFANGNYVFIGTNGNANVQVVQVIANSVTANTITVNTPILFSDTNAIVGGVLGNGSLYGYLGAKTRSSISAQYLTIDNVTSNTTIGTFANTSGANGNYIIGSSSGSFANVVSIVDLYYDSITTQFAEIAPRQTSSVWSFKGTSNTRTIDSNFSAVQQNIPNEFIDQQRMVMSRSNEIKSSSGVSSLQVSDNIFTANTKISPYTDRIRHDVTLTHNIINPDYMFNGYTIVMANTAGTFAINDVVWQSNSTVNTSAIVVGSNSTALFVCNVVSSNSLNIGTFNSNGTSTIKSTTSGGLANVVSVSLFGESIGGGFRNTRYISKNVILADKQDAEDLVCYLSAYRPTGTNIQVYGRFSAGTDSAPFNNNDWSRLVETSSPALQSSLVNRNDFVELVYDLPTSVNIFNSGANVVTTSANVLLYGSNTTSSFTPGMWIYLSDASYYVANATVVAGGSSYSNGTVVHLSGAPLGFTNATFSVSTNTSGGVTSATVVNPGVYTSNSTLTGIATVVDTTGTGSGLTLTVSNFNLSTKFNVRQVVAVPNANTLVLSSNVSFSSPNTGIGYIPGMQSQYSAFRYDQNNAISRYATLTDSVFDNFKTFAVKIVLSANSSQVVPRMTNFRALALQV
jgi:hypothetical protein